MNSRRGLGRKRANKRALHSAALLGAALLAACGGGTGPAPAGTPTPVTDNSALPYSAGSHIVADGRLEPAAYAEVGFSAGGVVAEVLVEAGQAVRQGELLARLGHSAALTAEQARAALAVQEAEAALRALMRADPAAEAAARHAALQAQADLDEAHRRLGLLSQPSTAYYEAAAQQARDALVNAQENLRLSEIGGAATAAQAAEAQLSEAASLLQDATSAQAQCPNCVEVYAGGQMLSLAEAQAIYDAAAREAEAARILRAQAQRQAEAAVEQRREEVAQAEARLNAAKEPNERAFRLAELAVAEAEARLLAAEARLEAPSLEDVALAQARLASAEAALGAAEAVAAALELRAPMDGIIAEAGVQAGESVAAGQAVFTLAQLDAWVVVTTNLTEREVVWLRAGHSADVRLDAVPGETYAARVVAISERYEQLAGDVVYAVTLTLDGNEPRWRWGMTVEVLFETPAEGEAN